MADGSRARREPPSQKAIAPVRRGPPFSSPLLSARCDHAHGRAGTIALGEGSADAIGKAIARRMPPASSCMTTAQPGRTSSPPRPAGRLLAWQRHSEPGPAARAEAVVAPPGTNRPGCARSRQAPSLLSSRFRASRVTFVRGQRPYRRSPRSRSSGCCSARAKRPSHRCRDKRCSVSSFGEEIRALELAPGRSRNQERGNACWSAFGVAHVIAWPTKVPLATASLSQVPWTRRSDLRAAVLVTVA